VYVCVATRANEKETEKEREREREGHIPIHTYREKEQFK